MAAHRITFVENRVENNKRFGLSIAGYTDGTVIRDNTIQSSEPGGVGIQIGPHVGEVILESNQVLAPMKMVDQRQQ